MKNFFRKLLGWSEPKAAPAKRAIDYAQAVAFGLIGPTALSGVTVTDETCLSLSAFWRCARVLAESVGTMPLKVYRRGESGREEATEHPAWELLQEPNPEQSAVEFYTLIQWWAVVHGNAYAEIVRDGSGRAVEMWPIPPWVCQPIRTDAGELAYLVRTPNQQDVTIAAADVVHLKGPSPDGSEGYKLAKVAADSMGFSIALDRFGSAYFGNSCKVGGVLKTAGQLSEQARENLRKSWATTYQGVDNTGKIAVLEEGLDYSPFQIDNNAGQYTETRQQQVIEICRWLGVDPIFCYEYGRATYHNAEAQTRNFLQFSLNPWLKRLESEITRKVLPKEERRTYYPEFVRESIIQMDAQVQSAVWATGVQNGWYTPDEIRKWLNLPALPKPEPKPEPQPNPEPQEEANGTPKPSDQLPE